MVEVDHTSQTAKSVLALDVLRAGCAVRLTALGTSMLPTIWPGDIVSVDSSRASEIRVGDIVLVARDDRFGTPTVPEAQ